MGVSSHLLYFSCFFPNHLSSQVSTSVRKEGRDPLLSILPSLQEPGEPFGGCVNERRRPSSDLEG